MDAEELKQRTKRFALQVIELVNKLPQNKTTFVIGNQLIRSGTSVGANYRSACQGRSKADFISKMGVVLEEADETLYWLELLLESGIVSQQQLAPLMKEANELVAIFTASLKTARSNSTRQ